MTEANAGDAVDAQQNDFGAALEVAQHAVDEAAQGRSLEQLDGIDGLGHGGVGRNPGVNELVEADQDQVVEDTALVLERFVHHLADRRIEAGQPAQGAVAEFLQEGAIARRNLLLSSRQYGWEGLALIQHLLNDESGLCTCFHMITLDAQVGAWAPLVSIQSRSIQLRAGFKPVAARVEQIRDGHGFLAGRLQGQQAQHTLAGGDIDPLLVGLEQGTGTLAVFVLDDLGLPHLDGLTGDLAPTDGPGIEGADAALDSDGVHRPVDAGLFLGELLGIVGQGIVLRLGGRVAGSHDIDGVD